MSVFQGSQHRFSRVSRVSRARRAAAFWMLSAFAAGCGNPLDGLPGPSDGGAGAFESGESGLFDGEYQVQESVCRLDPTSDRTTVEREARERRLVIRGTELRFSVRVSPSCVWAQDAEIERIDTLSAGESTQWVNRVFHLGAVQCSATCGLCPKEGVLPRSALGQHFDYRKNEVWADPGIFPQNCRGKSGVLLRLKAL